MHIKKVLVLKKIIVIVLMTFGLLVSNFSTVNAVTTFGINYVPEKTFVTTTDQISIGLVLFGASTGLTGINIHYTDLDNAFEQFSITGNFLTERAGISWDDSHIPNNKLAFSTNNPAISRYHNDEEIAKFKFRIKPGFKGKTARVQFTCIEAYDGKIDSYLGLNEEVTATVEFHINQKDEIITSVRYTLDPSYIITIPETVIASDTNDVEIKINGDVNLEEGKLVKVSTATGNIVLDRYKMDGITKVTGAGADTIETKLKLGVNDVLNTTPIAMFEYGKNNLIQEVLSVSKLSFNNKKAGQYIGSIIFNVNLINK